jgi:hypothetical protein
MRRVIGIGLPVCLIAVGLLAGQGTPQAAGSPHLMAPNPVAFAAAGGVTVALREGEGDSTHLHFAVCGEDVTRLPRGFPLTFVFDTPVRRMAVAERPPGMLVRSHTATHAMTVTLTRDPFTPPEPWHLAMRIAFDRVPGTGRIDVGPAEAHDVSYRSGVAVAPRRTGAGTGCLELLAAGQWQQRAS